MNRRRSTLALVLMIALLVALLVAVITSNADDAPSSADNGDVELAGMALSKADVREMTQDTMGSTSLADVPEMSPSGATSTPTTGTLANGVRTFQLSATPIRWEYRSGQTLAAWGYEGQVPGPVLRANEGEKVKIEFVNKLPQATTVHWHGVDVPWQQDGVPGVSQKAIEPGESFTYEFTATPTGTRWYHTHGAAMGEEAMQLDMGLAGALIIAPRRETPAKVDATMVLDEWNIGAGGYNAAMLGRHGGHGTPANLFTINGRAAPDIDDIVVNKGDTVRMRFINASTTSYHPMHVHGHQFRVTALDGNPVPSPVTRNVVLLAPGETADIEFVANNPGVWMLHCHDLHHADAGMAMLLRYAGYEPISAEHSGGDQAATDADH